MVRRGGLLVIDPLVSQETIMDKQEWLDRYKKRMLERGLNERETQAITEATETDEFCGEGEPEDAADDELSYWASDG